MPNWCENSVEIKGAPAKVAACLNEFKEMKERSEKQENMGQLPSGSRRKGHENHFFFITFYEGNPEETEGAQLCLDSKWRPALDELAQMCSTHQVKMEVIYSEFDNNIYGKAFIGPGEYSRVDLDLLAMEYEYDEDEETYTDAEGETFDSQSDLCQKYLIRELNVHLNDEEV